MLSRCCFIQFVWNIKHISIKPKCYLLFITPLDMMGYYLSRVRQHISGLYYLHSRAYQRRSQNITRCTTRKILNVYTSFQQNKRTQIAKFMGPTWGLSAPDGPLVGPTNLEIREGMWIHVQTTWSDREYPWSIHTARTWSSFWCNML